MCGSFRVVLCAFSLGLSVLFFAVSIVSVAFSPVVLFSVVFLSLVLSLGLSVGFRFRLVFFIFGFSRWISVFSLVSSVLASVRPQPPR